MRSAKTHYEIRKKDGTIVFQTDFSNCLPSKQEILIMRKSDYFLYINGKKTTEQECKKLFDNKK